MTLEVVREDTHSVMAVVRNVGFVGWREAPRVEDIRAWHQLGIRIAKAHPGTGACVDVVLRGKPSFSDDVRKEAVRMAGDAKIFELGWAHVILMPGFAGTAVRAFIGTVLLVARPASPSKVFPDVAAASRWLAPSLAPHGWHERDLRHASEELVERLGHAAA